MINTDGCFLGIAQRLEAEGRQVFSFYHSSCEKYSGYAGKGMVNIVDDFYDVLNQFRDKKDDLIILVDGNKDGDQWDYLRSEGWHVVGSSHMTEELEHVREDGEKLAKTLDLEIPTSVSFNDFAAARKFLEKTKAEDISQGLVFKGDGFEMAGGSFTHVAGTIDEMIEWVDWVNEQQSQGRCKVEKFMFQEVVEGIEVDFAAWFNGKQFAPALFVDFEQKRIHGLGAPTGCTGQIEFFLDYKKEPYFAKHFPQLLPAVNGDVPVEWAINNIVSDEDHKPYFLEFTPRFGWDSTIGELAILQDAGKSIAEFFECIALGKNFPKNFFPYKRYSCTIRLHSRGIWCEPDDCKGRPISWKPEYDNNFWWYAVKQRKDSEAHELTSNLVGCATACGDTPEESMAKVYEIIDPKNGNITVPDLFYSETIGEGVSDYIKKLKSWGIMAED
jgi:phosphoribosylamine-glycine ligase